MNNIKISVIIPIYNKADSLKRCLDSVITQTLREIEIICIDDGSTDSGITVLEAYGKSDKRIKIIRSQNHGTGTARNTALQSATGRYVAFLDADDYYTSSQSLELLLNAALRESAAICGGSLQIMEEGVIIPPIVEETEYSFSKEGWIDYKDSQQDYYFQRFIYDRSLLNRNGVIFLPYKQYEDTVFLVRAMLCAEKFYAISEDVYTYTQNKSDLDWDIETQRNALKAIRDELVLTNEHQLSLLHYRILRHLDWFLDWSDRNLKEIAVDSLLNELLGIREQINFKYLTERVIPSSLFRIEAYVNKGMAQCSENVFGAGNSKAIPISLCVKRTIIKEKPEVSVVVPVYNVAEYLTDCIDSLLEQSLHNIEIILVNDGSTDDSFSTMLQYSDKDERISVYVQKNAGLSIARNTGVSYARGRYIYFMDGDDILKPEALKKLTNYADANELELLLFDATVFSNAEELSEKVNQAGKYLERSGKYEGVYTGPELLSLMVENDDYCTRVWIQLIRRSFYISSGLGFIPGILHEDNAYTFKAFAMAKKISYLSDKFYLRRIRMNSIMTRDNTFDNVRGYFISFLDMIKTIEDADLTDMQQDAFTGILLKVLDTVKVIYQYLPHEEKDRYSELPPYQRKMFELLILSGLREETMQSLSDGQMDPEMENPNSGQHNEPEIITENNNTILPVEPADDLGFLARIKKMFNRLLPSSRHNVAWSYSHLTEQLQTQTKMLDHLLSMESVDRQELLDMKNTQEQLMQLCTYQKNMYYELQKSYEQLSDLDRDVNEIRYTIENLSWVVDGVLLDQDVRNRRKKYEWNENNDVQCLKKMEMTDAPLISVVLPVFNVEPFLRDCLKSLVGQTLNNIEIVCIDDGSTDDSKGILLEYAERDHRISVYKQKNKGLSNARNKGVQYARGKYLFFMDSDDILKTDALEKLFTKALMDDLDVLFFNADVFPDNNTFYERLNMQKKYFERDNKYEEIYTGKDLCKEMVKHGEYISSAWLQLIKKEFFVQADLWFIDGVYHEDNAYTFRCFALASRVSYIPDKLYLYRIRENSISTMKQSFEHIRGLFYNYLDMIHTMQEVEFLPEERAVFEKIIKGRIRYIKQRYSELEDDERRKYMLLPLFQRRLFIQEILEDVE